MVILAAVILTWYPCAVSHDRNTITILRPLLSVSSSTYSPEWGVSKESIGKALIRNRFHVKWCIRSLEICKQRLQVKSWKPEVRAEKAKKNLKWINHSTSSDIKTFQLNWLTSRTQTATKSGTNKIRENVYSNKWMNESITESEINEWKRLRARRSRCTNEYRSIRSTGVARGGQRGHGPPKMFRKYSHSVVWKAFF